MTLFLVRHGATAQNLLRKYMGKTDPPLCEQGIRQVRTLSNSLALPKRALLLSSPMKRCIQTAALLFPCRAPLLIEEFREMDFGDFEGRSADEMTVDPAYAAWVQSNCTTGCPNGEHPAQFKERCCSAFLQILTAFAQEETVVIITHGGVIAAILERFALPKRDFYDYSIQNGGCIRCEAAQTDGGMLCLHIR